MIAALLLGSTQAAPDAEARRPREREVGYSLTLGGHTFRIWGARPTGIMPKGVSVSADGTRVFVTNFGRKRGQNLDVFDAKSLDHRRSVDYDGNSIESLPSPDGKTLYLTNLYGFLVQALDTGTWAQRWSVRVGRFPKMLALSPDGKDLYVSSWESGTVSRLDASTGKIVVSSPRVGPHPRGLALHPKGQLLYLALTGGKHVLALRPDTLAEDHRIRTAGLPRHLALTRDGSRLYVSCIGGSLLQVIDTASRKVIRAVHLAAGPRTLALSKDERFVYVAAYAGHGLTIVDTLTWKKSTLDLDLVKSSGVAVGPDDRFIYVTGWCTKDLWAVERLPPGATPGPLGRAVLQRHRLARDPKTAWHLDCPRPAPRPRKPPPTTAQIR